MVVPKKALGQHFLVDRNLLGVIGRLADLQPADVVLEVGPGVGVLTRYLAERVRLVHAVELDASLRGPLEEALAGVDNVRLVFGDALRLDLATLDPPAGKLVANLPYNVATPLLLEVLARVPTLVRFSVMVQRELAERLFARPGTKAYGAVSVLVQLQARRLGVHRVPPSAFRPRPRVESAIVAFERTRPPLPSSVHGLVDAAFAHRRKTLANSLELAGRAARADAESALAAIGRGAHTRAEELEPEMFPVLAEALG